MTPEQDQADHGSGVYLSNADVKGHLKPIFVENRAAQNAAEGPLGP